MQPLNSLDIIYIAGPMTGYVNFNYDAFNKMEEKLRGLGYRAVVNPAKNFGGDKTLPRAAYMKFDVYCVLQATAVVFLEGWKKSEGAKLEFAISREFKLKQYNQNLKPLKEKLVWTMK